MLIERKSIHALTKREYQVEPPANYPKCNAIQVKALLEFAGTDKVFYGSDFPYAPEETLLGYAENLGKIDMSEETRAMVYNGNAKRLFGWK